tara:strand:+ start:1564 stop:2274 length:711 start_codon:yes stop_codon:yes gene_type:complete
MSKNGTVDYSKGLIYKLCCKDPTITDIYIGSTTNMRNRKNRHKNACNNPNTKDYNYKVYQTIREFGGFDNWDMILVEYVNATSKQELEKEERVVIELLKPNLNSSIPTRTNKEYRKDNKEKISEIKKIYNQKYKQQIKTWKALWYEENKEKILEKNKIYYKENKEKFKEKQKEYREENKEQIKEKAKQYSEQNKKKIKEREKIKVKCEFCECLIKKYGLKIHQKTVKCKKFQLLED